MMRCSQSPPGAASARPGRGLRGHALLVATALFAGCPAGDAPEDSGAALSPVDVAIAVAVPAGSPLSERWRLAAAEWEAAHGTGCRLDEIDFAAAQGAMPPLPEDTALLAAPLPLVPELIDSGWAAPIDADADPEALAAWQDLFRGLQSGAASPGKRPTLVPIECPVLVCCYRADLLEAAGRTPPRSWTEYQALLDALPDWAPGLVAVEPWSREFRASMFLARAAPLALHPDNVSLYLDSETGRPAIAEPPFVQALDDARRALARLDPRSAELGPDECFREVVAGRAALAIALPAAGGMEEVRREDARIGCSPLPGADRVFHRQTGEWAAPPNGAPNRVTLIGFRGLAACVSSEAAEPAQRTAWRVWSAFDSQDAATADGESMMHRLCRTSLAAAATPNPPAHWPAGEWREYVQAVTTSLDATRTAFDLPFPRRAEFRRRLTDRLSEAIDGTRPSADALEQAAHDWQALCDELGARRVLNTVRACSGLSPLPPSRALAGERSTE